MNPRVSSVLVRSLAIALLLVAAPASAGTSPPKLDADGRPNLLSGPSGADPLEIADGWLAANLGALGLDAVDLDTLELDHRYRSETLGTQLFYQQRVGGIPVWNAITSVHVLPTGEILAVNNSAVDGVAGRVSALAPAISAADALAAALADLGRPAPTASVLRELDAARQGVALVTGGATKRPVPVQLVYSPRPDGAVRLAWELYLMTSSEEVWYVHVDALDGAILERHNLVTTLNRYRVYPATSESPISTEDPTDRGHELVAEPADPVASPAGWVFGLTTTGNNVVAVEDRDNTDTGGFSPTGLGLPGSLTFDFRHDDAEVPCEQPGPLANVASDPASLDPCAPYDPLGHNSNLEASIVNLFYWNNYIHDVMWHYGFTEGAGNFQTSNSTAEGSLRGNDAVFAQAQDGSGTNNANFFTPPDDGVTPILLPPAMQMYEWSPPAVVRVNLPLGFEDFDDGDRVLSAATASFGASLDELSELERTGDLMIGNDGSTGDGTGTPTDGCEPLVGFVPGRIALLDRGLCEFGVKVLNAEQAGAKAVVLANTLGREVGNPMGPGVSGGAVTIPSVMIGESNGNRLKAALGAGIVNLTLEIVPVPNRDSDLDAGVIAHEYGHGISNRLIGGPSSIACLINGQLPDTNSPGALIPIGEQMGEGWSDLFALILTAQPSDTATTPRGIGAYVSFQGEDGPGIRRFPYSRDPATNPLTYGDVPTEVVPHGVGTVWATMVWDLYWDLVDQHGFEPDLFDHASPSGNVRALHLINDGLVVTKCRPSFVDGRNGILLAEAADGDLEDHCTIWRAFARRGLGLGAVNPTLGEDHRQALEDFTVPPHCAAPDNQAPAAAGDAFSTRRNQKLAVAAPGVLGNDEDPEGAALRAVLVSGPSNAKSFALRSDGSFDYQPQPGWTGTDSFVYQAQDGELGSADATVTIEVRKR